MLRASNVLRRLFAICLGLLPVFVSCDNSSIQGLEDEPLAPGEACDAQSPTPVRLFFDPPRVVLAPGQTRVVRVTVEPDLCVRTGLSLSMQNASIANAPTQGTISLRRPIMDIPVAGTAAGQTVLAAKLTRADGSVGEATLPIDVRAPNIPRCTMGEAQAGTMAQATPSLAGSASLAGAKLSVPAAAFAAESELPLPSFGAELRCDGDLTADIAAPVRPIGPAIAFGAATPALMGKAQRRELDFAVPVNPAAFPDAARLRHVVMLFRNPLRAKKARPIVISNPRIVQEGAGYVLKFSAPWFGTYQPVVPEAAGTQVRTRKLSHRALLGVSMGGGGAASFGMRHHDKFDVIAPLGGPSDWTWLLWYIEKYVTGGFCPDKEPNCKKYGPNEYPIDEPFVHTMDWNHWWYQEGAGNGGRFPRSQYIQIFEDLALMQGNPNGQHQDPKLSHMAPGPLASDPWITGGAVEKLPGTDCTFAADSDKDDPKQAQRQRQESACRKARCDAKNIWKAPKNFFNAEYNPEGKYQVISFCDGAEKGTSPYLNTWAPPDPNNPKPVNMVLAVDKNGNGVRDQDEPVIRAGHEPWDDSGVDGKLNPDEPGYDALTNPDPNQDDYDYVINPGGTEGNHRYEAGEPFRDDGLDGVPNTRDRHVAGDVGEGDGVFTLADGLKNFYANDAHSIIRRLQTNVPGGALSDEALLRLDTLADGGVRDLFNFGAAANHFMGSLASRTQANGLPLRRMANYNGFHFLPGQDESDFAPANLRYADMPDLMNVRYGNVDASAAQIKQGDGMHVGTVLQILYRLELGFFYVSQRWPDADRTQARDARENPATTTINELGVECELRGRCSTQFTGPKSKRKGPIAVGLPPGYALAENVGKRYPVLYLLHGYGQDPRDLEALAVFTNSFMNAGDRSSATRLGKFITVYVDGKCRGTETGNGECFEGTFYLNSNRADGPQMDTWFDEVIDYVDRNYRTLGPSEISVPD
jgi:hypothetical protein